MCLIHTISRLLKTRGLICVQAHILNKVTRRRILSSVHDPECPYHDGTEVRRLHTQRISERDIKDPQTQNHTTASLPPHLKNQRIVLIQRQLLPTHECELDLNYSDGVTEVEEKELSF